LITERPAEQRHCRLQLAKHYELSGRPLQAAKFYREAIAAEAPPQQNDDETWSAFIETEEATAALKRLQLQTPTCVWWR
jgi:hypothetical protein